MGVPLLSMFEIPEASFRTVAESEKILGNKDFDSGVNTLG